MADSRWPQKGDKLFRASTWLYDAPLPRDPGERFYRMPMGYKRAGDLLAEQAERDGIDRTNIIYAALFCYRQAVELFLKKIISDFAPHLLADKGRAPGHNLSKLWDAFTMLLRERSRENEEGVTAVAAIVAELQNADEQSDGFRYPTDRKNLPFKFGDRGIDLVNLREVMDGIATFFDCVHAAFAYEDDIDEQMRQDGLP